jgi:ankyrin repeat protein
LLGATGDYYVPSKLMNAICRGDIATMKQAIATGADPNEIHDGMTPLVFAVYRGDEDAVRLLLENGANPNLWPDPSDPDHSPLWHAEDDFGLTAIADLLKSYGATK